MQPVVVGVKDALRKGPLAAVRAMIGVAPSSHCSSLADVPHSGRLVSRSPRRSLRMALDALDDLVGVQERHPEARQELEGTLGPELLAEVLRSRETIARAVARLDGTGGADSMTPG